MNKFGAFACGLLLVVGLHPQVYGQVGDGEDDGGAKVERAYPIIDTDMNVMPFFVFKPPSGVKSADELLELTIKTMDENGVQYGVLNGLDNATVRKWVEKEPKRFLPSFNLAAPMVKGGEDQKQIEKDVDDGKWVAVGELLLPYAGLAINDRSIYPFYRFCEEKGLPVFFQCGAAGPKHFPGFRLKNSDPLLFEDVLEEFPKMKVVICHLGWPLTRESIYIARVFPKNVYLSTGGVAAGALPREEFHAVLKQMVALVGSDRILFGTHLINKPERIPIAIEAIDTASFLEEEDKRKIFYVNASELFQLQPEFMTEGN